MACFGMPWHAMAWLSMPREKGEEKERKGKQGEERGREGEEEEGEEGKGSGYEILNQA